MSGRRRTRAPAARRAPPTRRPTAAACICSPRGPATEPSFFGGADEAGDNAFLFTYSPLVAQDTDSLADLYDARVGGGLAAQQAGETPPCDLDAGACQGPATSAPGAQSPATPSFQGEGNVTPKQAKRCPKGKRRVKRHGKVRCVAKRHHKRHRHHKRKHHAKQRHGKAKHAKRHSAKRHSLAAARRAAR